MKNIDNSLFQNFLQKNNINQYAAIKKAQDYMSYLEQSMVFAEYICQHNFPLQHAGQTLAKVFSRPENFEFAPECHSFLLYMCAMQNQPSKSLLLSVDNEKRDFTHALLQINVENYALCRFRNFANCLKSPQTAFTGGYQIQNAQDISGLKELSGLTVKYGLFAMIMGILPANSQKNCSGCGNSCNKCKG